LEISHTNHNNFKIGPRILHQSGVLFWLADRTESFKFSLDPPLMPW